MVKRKAFPCTQCSYVATHGSHLKQHVAVKHSTDKPMFPCTQCSYVATAKGNLKQHIAFKHSTDKPMFPCTQCSHVATRKSGLKRHIAVKHSTDKPMFPCTQCSYVATEKSHLKRHVAIKHSTDNRKAFPCTQCSYVATQKSHLERHVAIKHSTEKPAFPCTQCSYVATDKSTLERHVAVKHSTDKPAFPCTQCSYVATEKGNLKRTDKPAFPCTQCSYVATEKGNLKRHVVIVHKGQKIVRPKNFCCDDPSCAAMGVAFRNASELEAHRIALHTKEGRQRRKIQEEAMKNALVLAGYKEIFTKGLTPGPRGFLREVYFDHRCALGREFLAGEKKFAYVDFVVRSPDGRLVFLEVDEGQHWSYPQLCETTRMQNICASIALSCEMVHVLWLRFHPDRPFRWRGEEVHPKPADRRREVVALLNQLQSSEADPPMQVAYAFYDSQDGEWPDVLGNPEYAAEVKPTVVAVHERSDWLYLPWKPRRLWPRPPAPEAEESGDEGDEDALCVVCSDEEESQPGSSAEHAAMSQPLALAGSYQSDSDDGVAAKRARVRGQDRVWVWFDRPRAPAALWPEDLASSWSCRAPGSCVWGCSRRSR